LEKKGLLHNINSFVHGCVPKISDITRKCKRFLIIFFFLKIEKLMLDPSNSFSPTKSFYSKYKFLNNVLHCTTLYNTVKYYTLQQCTTLYNTVQHCTTLYNTVQHCTTLYNTVLRAGSHIRLWDETLG
jgi:hypothetical protein